MRKIAIVYWSGTGNTEAMAAAVAEGVQASGAEAVLETAAAFDVAALDAYDAVAFGCPSMGAEELEESEFAPMFETCERKARRQAARAVRLLRLGRRRVDAELGGTLPGRRRGAGLRAGHLQRGARRRGAGRVQGARGGAGTVRAAVHA